MVPPKANPAFVAAMEDVLDAYMRAHQSARSPVCLGETPKLVVLGLQCLARSIPDAKVFAVEVDAWIAERNTHHAKANGRFATADARIKLKSPYSVI